MKEHKMIGRRRGKQVIRFGCSANKHKYWLVVIDGRVFWKDSAAARPELSENLSLNDIRKHFKSKAWGYRKSKQ